MIFLKILKAKFFKKEFKKINQKLDLIIREVTPKPEFTISFMFKDIKVATGGKVMYIVKNDNPDVNYTITPPAEVKDAEGEVIPNPVLVYEVSSTDPSVVQITPDADPKTGSVHFGTSGIATFNVAVRNTSGVLVGSGAASFTVTVGDPATISAITLSFDGLTEAPEA